MADYFSMAEMTENSLAVRLGIDNTPSLAAIRVLGATVVGLEKIRALFGLPIHVSSGYRCEALERIYSEQDYRRWCADQGAPVDDASWRSYFAEKAHPKGYAADFTCAQFGSHKEVFDAITQSSIAFDQCILEGTWVHISFDPRMRRQILTKDFDVVPSQSNISVQVKVTRQVR